MSKGQEIPAIRTKWAPYPPKHHLEVCVNMDGILRSCGVRSATVRRRMTINAIEACGWKQKCWNFNAFGVQNNRKVGNWYVMASEEEEKDGTMKPTPDQPWKAFNNWLQAVKDYFSRIHVGSKKYGKAASMIVDDSVSDGEWWQEQSINYNTTSKEKVKYANSIGAMIKKHLAAATQEQKDFALSIPTGSIAPVVVDPTFACPSCGTLLKAAIVGAVVFLLWRYM